MEEIVDFEYLLRPIDEPVENPRIERFEIRSHRNAEFDKEEQYNNFMEYGSEFGEEKSPEPPDWSGFVRACEGHLAKKVKDLWVCAWYAEALLIRDGFQGLAQGLDLAKRMIEEMWDSIEPNPAGEDGVADTVKMFAGLNNGSAFIDRIKMTPISEATGDHGALTVATMDDVGDDVRARLTSSTGADFQEPLGEGIRACIANFDMLSELFKEKCGDDAPPSAKVRETLNNCLNRILEIYPSLEIVEESVAEEGEDGETGLVQNNGEAAIGVGALGTNHSHIQNREEAFKLLERVSQFFRENEPSSPVSYALIQAVRWGRMSLPDLINDLVDDGDAKSQIFRVTGIKSSGESGDEYSDED